ncbi:hypothetical protein [Absidia glauca]|uniref:BD-FAE-like domain-containing protein n=1 Tax=Absidia glauca TaxID=4829 RepID=A0A168LWR6_ABSGL|nr:hypothetical protein [Absidia glauca]
MTGLLASSIYFLWVLVGAALNIDTFYPHQVAKVLFHRRSLQLRPLVTLLEIHVSLRGELPLHLFGMKILMVGFVYQLGGFDRWWTRLIFYGLDIPNLLAYLYMFWEMVQERPVFTDALPMQMDLSVNAVPMNPLWRPKNVSVFSNITYATQEELMELEGSTTKDLERQLQLDVYNNNISIMATHRRVLLHVHGGGWQQGSKNIFYPFEKTLVARENWVVVNMTYRLAPAHPYPAQLYDIKRALRWVKQNIHAYGGFESVDTSIRGVISLNGILDLQSDQDRMMYFTQKVAGQDSIDLAFLGRHSPLHVVKHQGCGVPFLVLAGNRDMMVDTSIATRFKAALDDQEGAVAGGVSTTSSYTCDPNTCKLPNCLCASTSPPGGLQPKDTPQFVVITFDDSVQPKLLQTAQDLLNVKNPNGCPAKTTPTATGYSNMDVGTNTDFFFFCTALTFRYVSMEYTDFSLVQQWYANGNEVAEEIAAAKSMLHEYGGIPYGKLKGFRAPFLNYTAETLSNIQQQGFQYDSSSTATVDDCFWPYTLDNGMANDCWTGICDAGKVKLPGVWELPMYAVMDDANTPQLMDVYLAGSVANVTNWSNTNFQRHYTGNRQPFGIYVHPTHLTNYPGTADTSDLKKGVVDLIQSFAGKEDIWFVTNQQLLSWMQNPVPNSQLASQSYMQCTLPNTGKEICNGLENITISADGVASGNKPSAASTMTPVYGILVASVVAGLTGLLL